MIKKSIITALTMVILLIIIVAVPVLAGDWTASNHDIIEIGDYQWYNYDFQDQSSYAYDNVDWPISVIFYGPGAEVDDAKDLLWFYDIADWQDARYKEDGGSWEWDLDMGRKSALGDSDAWHCRVYAETSGDRCTHDTWDYYVVGSTHRDYLDYPSYEYYGDTESANVALCIEVGWDIIEADLFDTDNYESWRKEGDEEPYHLWNFSGEAEGIYME